MKKGLGVTDAEVDTIVLESKGRGPGAGPAAGPGGPGGPEEEFMMPLEEMMTAKDFDKLLEKHKDCKLIVSMIGLPRDAGNLRVLKMSKTARPRIALLNGDIHSMQGAIAAGFIVAATSYKPGVKYTEDAPPKDVQKAFDDRYLLITPENVKSVAEQYKGLFQ